MPGVIMILDVVTKNAADHNLLRFPRLPFWQFLPPKLVRDPQMLWGKGPELCLNDQSRIIFIYLWSLILMYFWLKGKNYQYFGSSFNLF